MPKERLETAGKLPLRPLRNMTERTGARHNGCVDVGEGVELAVRDCELLGVTVLLMDADELRVSLGVAIGLSVLDEEPVRVVERDSELLGVSVREDVCVIEPVRELDALGVALRVDDELPELVRVVDALLVEVLVVDSFEVAVFDGVSLGVAVLVKVIVCEIDVVRERVAPEEKDPVCEAVDVEDKVRVGVNEAAALILGEGSSPNQDNDTSPGLLLPPCPAIQYCDCCCGA